MMSMMNKGKILSKRQYIQLRWYRSIVSIAAAAMLMLIRMVMLPRLRLRMVMLLFDVGGVFSTCFVY